MSTITDEQVEAAARAIFVQTFRGGIDWDKCQNMHAEYVDRSRAALAAAAQAGKPLPIPKSFHWLGDREAAEITLHETDVRGCVAYFDRQSDCLEFMRQVTNSATAHEAERVEPPLSAAEFWKCTTCKITFDPVVENAIAGSCPRCGHRTTPQLDLLRGQESDEAGRGTAQLSNLPDADPSRHKGASPSASVGIGERVEAPATPGRAHDWQGKVDAAMDLYELATSPSPPAQSLANEPYLEVVTPFNMLCPDCGDVGLNYKNDQMVKKVDCPKCGLRLFSMTPPAQSVEGEDASLIDRLRKQAVCVYLAAEEGPAKDLSDGLTKAADRIAILTNELAEARRVIEPFAREFKHFDGAMEAYKIGGNGIAATITAGHLRAARDWLERNK